MVKLKSRLTTVFLLTLTSFSVLLPLIRGTAQAAAFTSDDPAQAEYVQMEAYASISECLSDSKGIDLKDSDLQDLTDDMFWQGAAVNLPTIGGPSGVAKTGVSNITSTFQKASGISQDTIDCNNQGDITKLLKLVGFSGVRDFANKIQSLYGTQYIDSSNLKSTLSKYMSSNHLGGQGKTITTLSPAAMYWYWNNIYTTVCSGERVDKNYTGSKNTLITNGPFYSVVKTTDSSGNATYSVQTKDAAAYKLDPGADLENLDTNITIQGTDNPTCQQIVKGITQAEAKAYADLLTTTFKNTGKALNPNGSTSNTPQADTGKSACEDARPVISLNWYFCGLLDVAQDTVTGIYGHIEDVLGVRTDLDEQDPQLQAVWSYFRIIATSLLVVIGLVMVISQAIGSSLFDAYTIKKVLPRLIIGVIAVQLSYWLCIWIMKVNNNIAWGLQDLLYAPFGGADNLKIGDVLTGNGAAVAGLAGIGAITATVGTFGIIGALSLLLSALIALIIAFFVLALRQALLIVLLVASPIAIVAWILPNTEKVWKLWWESFSKALLMFPMIVLLISGGTVAGYVVGKANMSNGDSASYFTTFIVTICVFGPYFLIPKTFQLAGGALSNLAGITNDRSRGAFDRLKNYRGQKASENWAKTKAGERLSERNRLTSRLNKIGAGAAQNPFTGFGFSQRGKANMEKLKNARAEERLKEPGVNQMLMDDDVRGALAVGASRADAFLAAKGIAKGSKKYNEVMGAARSIGFNNSSRLAAVQGESTHGKGRNMEAISQVYGAGGDQSLGMNRLVADVGTSAGLGNMGTERLRQNTMYQFGANGRGDLRQGTLDEVMDGKFDTGLIRGITGDGMQALAGAEVARLRTGSRSQQEQASAQLLAMHESRTGMAQPAIDELDHALTAAGVDLSSTESVDMQLAKQLASPADRSAYDTARTNHKAAQDALAAAQAAGTATTAHRDAVQQAGAVLALAQQPITSIAQEARAKSATYSSSLPLAAREQP